MREIAIKSAKRHGFPPEFLNFHAEELEKIFDNNDPYLWDYLETAIVYSKSKSISIFEAIEELYKNQTL